MSTTPSESGLAPILNARLYYETACDGQPLVMIHAGGTLRRRRPEVEEGDGGKRTLPPSPSSDHPLPPTQAAVGATSPRWGFAAFPLSLSTCSP
jgi:hypothetical protein